MFKLTTELVAGDIITFAGIEDRVIAVELPIAPAVVAIIHVVRNGRVEWWASGVAATHEVI